MITFVLNFKKCLFQLVSFAIIKITNIQSMFIIYLINYTINYNRCASTKF